MGTSAVRDESWYIRQHVRWERSGGGGGEEGGEEEGGGGGKLTGKIWHGGTHSRYTTVRELLGAPT